MTVFEFREWLESSVPLWMVFATMAMFFIGFLIGHVFWRLRDK